MLDAAYFGLKARQCRGLAQVAVIPEVQDFAALVTWPRPPMCCSAATASSASDPMTLFVALFLVALP